MEQKFLASQEKVCIHSLFSHFGFVLLICVFKYFLTYA